MNCRIEVGIRGSYRLNKCLNAFQVAIFCPSLGAAKGHFCHTFLIKFLIRIASCRQWPHMNWQNVGPYWLIHALQLANHGVEKNFWFQFLGDPGSGFGFGEGSSGFRYLKNQFRLNVARKWSLIAAARWNPKITASAKFTTKTCVAAGATPVASGRFNRPLIPKFTIDIDTSILDSFLQIIKGFF